KNLGQLKPHSPGGALVGNALAATVQNFAPPIWPLAAKWNRWAETRVVPHLAFVREALPRFTLRTAELAQEEWAGVGLPVLALLLLALTGRRGPAPRPPRAAENNSAVLAAGLAAAVAFGLSLGSEMPARLL